MTFMRRGRLGEPGKDFSIYFTGSLPVAILIHHYLDAGFVDFFYGVFLFSHLFHLEEAVKIVYFCNSTHRHNTQLIWWKKFQASTFMEELMNASSNIL